MSDTLGRCPLCDRARPLVALRLVPGLRISYRLAVCKECATCG